MQVTICGIPFQIVQVQSYRRDDYSFGSADAKMATITICAGMPVQVRAATLVHEWMHAVLATNGVEHPESIVGVLATELYRQGFRVKVDDA